MFLKNVTGFFFYALSGCGKSMKCNISVILLTCIRSIFAVSKGEKIYSTFVGSSRSVIGLQFKISA